MASEITEKDVSLALKKSLNSYLNLRSEDAENEYEIGVVTDYRLTPVERRSVYNISMLYTKDGEEHRVRMQLKMIRPSKTKDDTVNQKLFQKELVFFGCIIPNVRELLGSNKTKSFLDCYLAQSQDHETLQQAPKYLPYSLTKGSTDLLALEYSDGFKSTTAPFDDPHLRLSIKALAQLHGLSKFLDVHQDDYRLTFLECFPTLVTNTYFNARFNPEFYSQVQMAVQIMTAILPLLGEGFLAADRVGQKALKVLRNELWEAMEEASKSTTVNKNTLCLVDCYPDNFVFLYDKSGPVTCKMKRMKNVNLTSPSTDLVSLLYNCTVAGFAPDELQRLMEVYYEEFQTTFLKSWNVKNPAMLPPGSIITFKELTKSFAESRLLGSAQRAVYASLGCLMNLDEPASEECGPRSDSSVALHHQVRMKLLEGKLKIPRSLERLKAIACHAVKKNPYYRSTMYESISDLLICLSTRT
ncbi:uncharacterized protein LOC132196331 [Neocloeon triangulifer]|uniref:uncharacterized protein LOC132196331 n=1 Tax=Neocloeon triangulifer TaxID=2078957 RepID=UPI00286EBECB|nr:uncharacterized protein LOC132196331 [Neocloeon triangulifer]XP_059474878.1 uncharacterized protein LOC132196331 [Neocloeon triangulifer]